MPTEICKFCGAILRRRYPGNDPENGPAGFNCKKFECQLKEQEEEFKNLLKEEQEKILEEERKFDEMCKLCHHDFTY